MCTSGVSFTFLAVTNKWNFPAHLCFSFRLKFFSAPKLAGALAGLSAWPSHGLRRGCSFCGADGPGRSRCQTILKEHSINIGRRKPDLNRIELLLWRWCRWAKHFNSSTGIGRRPVTGAYSPFDFAPE